MAAYAGTAVDLTPAIQLLTGLRIAVLTGAGMSTDSGIPDYRGPDSPPRKPMTYQQFISDADYRRTYWARNQIGWRKVQQTHPNDGHRALAQLEAAGVVTGLITQNVDLLHTVAGSRAIINLHGTYLQVICLDCGAVSTRGEVAQQLDALNPGFVQRVPDVEIAPDADAIIASTEGFIVADCAACGGMLKPDIVYFGENVPKPRVQAAYAMVDEADALLVAGSSLTVQSGLRFVRHAATAAKPIVILNRGTTRGDPMATLKLNAGCSPVLQALAAALTKVR